MGRKNAFITGITGQDGSYLTELLLENGYVVFGLARNGGPSVQKYGDHLASHEDVTIIRGDISDPEFVSKALITAQPDEIYNLASQSHVGMSYERKEETWAINYHVAINLINEALALNNKVKIYQASSSEMFGKTSFPQTETTPMNPQNPYGASKLATYKECVQLRNDCGAAITSGILYNHESPRRPLDFVTRKISYSMARIKLGLQNELEIGNIHAARDWGFAKDYVTAMWQMIQLEKLDDFVIATGISHTVKDFITVAATILDIKLSWHGTGTAEVGFNQNGKPIVIQSERFIRPVDTTNLIGDASKARRVLGWSPTITFEQLVELMVTADLHQLQKYG